MGSDEIPFNVSLIMRGKVTRLYTHSHTLIFLTLLREREREREIVWLVCGQTQDYNLYFSEERERERRTDRDLLQTEPGTEVMLKQGTKHCTIQNMFIFITHKLKHRNNEHIHSDRNHNKQANKRGIHIPTRTCLQQHYSLLQTLAVHELIRWSRSFFLGHDDERLNWGGINI